MTPSDPDEIAKQAREHAWNWFALHATQRMQAFNFFVVATAYRRHRPCIAIRSKASAHGSSHLTRSLTEVDGENVQSLSRCLILSSMRFLPYQ
jgi:hypothetical protein